MRRRKPSRILLRAMLTPRFQMISGIYRQADHSRRVDGLTVAIPDLVVDPNQTLGHIGTRNDDAIQPFLIFLFGALVGIARRRLLHPKVDAAFAFGMKADAFPVDGSVLYGGDVTTMSTLPSVGNISRQSPQ